MELGESELVRSFCDVGCVTQPARPLRRPRERAKRVAISTAKTSDEVQDVVTGLCVEDVLHAPESRKLA